ncbi:3-hydroxyacyl-CoA dehydrogenase family protein [Clostridium felsineum]|uniref:3-hydroxyacyl-CoA dehydrogenase family protein n=1 Tax=Clostridium felsineum TaxID=36839 RepID=UPI00098CBC0F|nr:3-hydroxyacyl-CoA dehydrogenase family protein [Clostridium felsineum]URZ15102.1 putative 3-hydroxybutyryl-CoA dehydrogenase [Clostridium felsineum DSM 794]
MNKCIGVIGAGVMGRGVSQRFAEFGYRVILVDINQEILDSAVNEIKRNLKFASMFNKKVNIDDVMKNINTSLSYDELKDVDYIVENVPEDEKIKQNVYKKLEQICKKDCIYMANTSCIPITLLGAFTKRMDKVIGVHFMNPVPLKNFAEVIQGRRTSKETIEIIGSLLKDIGISIEVINDSAGFVSNRLSHLFMNEAAFLVYENVATPKQIDNIFKKAFGHKMGPLETADLIGLDTVLDSLRILYDQYEDSKFRACPLLKRMVNAGELGRKEGKGFYKY